VVPFVRVWGARDKFVQAGKQRFDSRWGHALERGGEEWLAQHVGVLAQGCSACGSQPHENAAPVGEVGTTLQIALRRELSDDVAHHGLRTIEVGCRLPDCHWAGKRQVREHRPRCSREARTPPIPTVKYQVDLPKEPPELGCRILHTLMVRPPQCIVNPDASLNPYSGVVRLVIAKCSVDYAGRLSAHLPLGTRLLVLKADGSVLVHADSLSYKPLNWMSPPATFSTIDPDEAQAEHGVTEIWKVSQAKTADVLVISIHEILHDSSHDLGIDPGLQKDGVEADLQKLLAEQIELLGDGHRLVRREYMTAIGPVDILATDATGRSVAVEIKRRGDIDGVEQLTRYLELMNRDPLLAPVSGVFAAQEIKPQARVLAEDRGIRCLLLDYDEMRGLDDSHHRLF